MVLCLANILKLSCVMGFIYLSVGAFFVVECLYASKFNVPTKSEKSLARFIFTVYINYCTRWFYTVMV